ncbi:Terminase-like family protein [Pirellula sp. SH-Sr6A]|uniref:phage terminase large subunit n=1 Tax=Pirellula sp. SH-Sr6A TaxID=1632865 RepID=UPI00078D3090|nr:phage terminase large subunit [Pirellula sp. SH-Sr6A]AMV35715.1 Terminase-like family protein [Pirellula sp. SH-Sr6A]
MSGEVTVRRSLSNLDKIIRRHCELEFAEFVRHAAKILIPGFVWGNHIQVVCDHLQAVQAGKVDRLMVNLPPGCTKSTLLSVLWPAWVWTVEPDATFLCVTYNQDLTVRDAVACRELIADPWYIDRWGDKVQVAFGHDAKTFYRLTAGGWRLSTTRSGRATGDHPKYVIIDDPLSVEKSKNANERKAFNDWYRDTLSTRGVAKGVRHVVGMQRVHVDDPCGMFERENEFAERAGEEKPWHQVMLPMRYDPEYKMEDRGFGGDWRTEKGELLYPQLLDEKKVTKLERSLGASNSSAQLGQRPIRKDGEFFKCSNIKIIRRDEAPFEFDAVCRFWDRAASVEDGAYTAGALVGRKGSKFYLLHMIRKRMTAGDVEAAIEMNVKLDEIEFGFSKLWTCFEIEGASSGKRVAEITINRLRGHRVYGVRAKDSKEVHAEPLSIAIENGDVYAIEGPWLTEVFDEMEVFPSGPFKDQSDAFAGAYLELVNPSAKSQSVVVSSKAAGKPRFKEGKCQNPACDRPAFTEAGFCCHECERLAPEGEVCHSHTAECSTKYNDWYVKNSR